jgi:hypothetical protein
MSVSAPDPWQRIVHESMLAALKERGTNALFDRAARLSINHAPRPKCPLSKS